MKQKLYMMKLWQPAPADVLAEDAVKMLPREKLTSKCRLCGKSAELTKEHIPPKESGNKQRTVDHNIGDWLASQKLDVLPGDGKKQQGGIYGYTLCASCNNLTGALYGGEYQKWAFGGFDALAKLPQKPEELDKELGAEGSWSWTLKAQVGSKDNPVHPGAFVREVLSMFCSLSASWDLAERYPEIRRIILEQATEPLPQGFDLVMGLYLGPMLRFSGPQLRVNVSEGLWQWVMEVAYPPYSFLLVLCSNKEEALNGAVMNEMVMWETKKTAIYEAEFGVGFGWTPYPADYPHQYTHPTGRWRGVMNTMDNIRVTTAGLPAVEAIQAALEQYDLAPEAERLAKLINNKAVNLKAISELPTQFAKGKLIDISVAELLSVGVIGFYYQQHNKEAWNVLVGVDDSAKANVELILSDGAIQRASGGSRTVFQQVLAQGYHLPKGVTIEDEIIRNIKKKTDRRSDYPKDCGLIVSVYADKGDVDFQKVMAASDMKAFGIYFCIIYQMPKLERCLVYPLNDSFDGQIFLANMMKVKLSRRQP